MLYTQGLNFFPAVSLSPFCSFIFILQKPLAGSSGVATKPTRTDVQDNSFSLISAYHVQLCYLFQFLRKHKAVDVFWNVCCVRGINFIPEVKSFFTLSQIMRDGGFLILCKTGKRICISSVLIWQERVNKERSYFDELRQSLKIILKLNCL